ncbi:MAG: Hpt domain-containing protein [Pseudotabrizicola sp.]|uniref:Hpt domain-containing protein n=1 Tax=Pseudotabrizicola sp. TaxID=2939647 RepID=UPI00271EA581|nr:Hpt domain-containing protein [Pseudotabrizicola sp.]MDO9640113.1 Hpt domain-containing protein [Pseudotabrizicola sp.]
MTQPAEAWARALLPQFLDLTASRRIEIDIERGALEAGDDPVPVAQEICKVAHKIAGTAASFGFSRLGAQAQRVEEVCNQICTLSGPALPLAVRQDLLPALDELNRELDSALVGTN